VGAFPFPAVDGDAYDRVPLDPRPPLVIGGDIAVLAAPANADVADLVTRLAAPAAPLPWIRDHGGFIAPNLGTPRDAYSPVFARLARPLASPGQALVFNLSDELGDLGGREGLWRVLQDLLVQVGGRGPDPVPAAASAAADRMDQLAGQGR
jgi:alpha-glucoside transport system substrate-binding protein